MKTLFLPSLALAVLAAGCATDIPEDAFDYHTPYHRQLLSPGAQFGALPAAVQNTVRAQVGATEISHIRHDYFDHQDIYKIFFRNDQIWPALFVGADGAVYDPNLRVVVRAAGIGGDVAHGTKVNDLQVSDLPPEVLKVLHERGLEAEVSGIERQPWGNQSVFVISFKDSKTYPKLSVNTEGAVLKDIGK
jgi:hypothetical protein